MGRNLGIVVGDYDQDKLDKILKKLKKIIFIKFKTGVAAQGLRVHNVFADKERSVPNTSLGGPHPLVSPAPVNPFVSSCHFRHCIHMDLCTQRYIHIY